MFETLGLTLRVFRELSGCSQAELARKAQIGKSQLSKYESGKELPKLESLGKIITALGTTPLVVFYLSSVLDRATQLSGGLRAGLLEQGAATFFRSDREARRYREVFESFLGLFESAAEERVLAAVPKPGCREERSGSLPTGRRAGRRRIPRASAPGGDAVPEVHRQTPGHGGSPGDR